MIKACVFDLDGTLTDTLPTISYYVNLALRKYGLSDIEESKFRYFVGNGAKTLIRRSLAFLGCDEKDKALFENVYGFYNKAYDKAPLYLTKPYEGMKELVTALKQREIICAVLSNKPDFAAVSVVRYFYGDLFDIIHGARDGVALKPSPEALLSILSECGTLSDETFMVGDTNVDMKTGTEAGVKTVGVLWGFRDKAELREANAAYIVKTPAEILDLIN